MPELQVQAVLPREKGRVTIRFEGGTEVTLYKGEIRKLPKPEGNMLLTEGASVPGELYCKVIEEIIGSRARKRAMFLLEQRERTERQLYDKLKQNGYPEECIEIAITYVKQYHYIDDFRYARTYIRFHQEKKSRQKLKMDLMVKGVDKDTIERAMEEEFDSDEQIKIRQLLEKRHYDYSNCDQKEMQRQYQFLMRRGFKSSDILHIMKNASNFDE